MDATANIVNTTSLTTRIGIKGFDGINSGGFDALANILHRMRFKRRSIAVLCATHPTEHTKRQKRIIEYGQRSASDAIVRFQKETVAASSANYPKFTFDFSDPYVNITYVALTMTVCISFVFYFSLVYILAGHPQNNNDQLFPLLFPFIFLSVFFITLDFLSILWQTDARNNCFYEQSFIRRSSVSSNYLRTQQTTLFNRNDYLWDTRLGKMDSPHIFHNIQHEIKIKTVWLLLFDGYEFFISRKKCAQYIFKEINIISSEWFN